jgi:hypothetical protein
VTVRLTEATTFAAHFARWARARPSSSAARAAAVQRWENEGGSVRPADRAAAPKIPL